MRPESHPSGGLASPDDAGRQTGTTSPLDHPTTRPLDHIPLPALPPEDARRLSAFIFKHHSNLAAAAADLGCFETELWHFLQQPHIAAYHAGMTAHTEAIERKGDLTQLRQLAAATDDLKERRRTLAHIVSLHRIEAAREAHSRAPTPRTSRATTPRGSASEVVPPFSTAPRLTRRVRSRAATENTSDGAPSVNEGFAAPHQSATHSATDTSTTAADPAAAPNSARPTTPRGSASEVVPTSSTASRPDNDHRSSHNDTASHQSDTITTPADRDELNPADAATADHILSDTAHATGDPRASSEPSPTAPPGNEPASTKPAPAPDPESTTDPSPTPESPDSASTTRTLAPHILERLLSNQVLITPRDPRAPPDPAPAFYSGTAFGRYA